MSKPHDPAIPSVLDDDDDDDADKTKVGDTSGAKQVAGLGKRDFPYLIVVAGAGVGEMYRLERDEAIVGRGEKAQFRIVDDGISRMHARLVRSDDTLYVEDLESANGTLVNGEKIMRCALKDGDKISIGSTTILKFTYHDEIDEVFQQKMYEAALRDGLTKVYNKRFMLERLTTELAYSRRHKTDLTLLMMDIDHFKRVNDVHGHPAGDAVLIKVASTIQAVIRTEDILARFGGEEFAIICRNTDLPSSAILAERVRSQVESTTIEWDDKKIPVTVSIGIASAMALAAVTVEKLIAAADEVLYAAKRGGRNRVCKASPPA
jgi:two-component system, cell cycle response regulator